MTLRVAITRPRERSEDTIKLVEAHGWEALVVPTIEIAPRSKKEILAAVGKLEDYDWLVLTSASGAAIMHELSGSALKKISIAAIGKKTKEFLEAKGIKVALVPREYKAENLADALIEKGVENKKILVARASIGREVLVEELKKVAKVVEVPLYDTFLPMNTSEIKKFNHALKSGRVDAIIFTSSQAAKNFFKLIGKNSAQKLSEPKICAIGPITAQTLREFGARVDVMPSEYTVEACLRELERLKLE